MASAMNLSNQLGCPFRIPAQDKKSGPDTESIKEVEESMRISLQSPILVMPLGMTDTRLEVLDLEPVFEVDGYQD